MRPPINGTLETNGCKGAIDGLTLGNEMDGKDGPNDVLQIENGGMVVTSTDITNLEMDENGGVMETHLEC